MVFLRAFSKIASIITVVQKKREKKDKKKIIEDY